jgi:hypothetical protein
MDETRMWKFSTRFFVRSTLKIQGGTFPTTRKYSKSENGWVVIFSGIVVVKLEFKFPCLFMNEENLVRKTKKKKVGKFGNIQGGSMG